jgi:hypothetical protein
MLKSKTMTCDLMLKPQNMTCDMKINAENMRSELGGLGSFATEKGNASQVGFDNQQPRPPAGRTVASTTAEP